MTLSPIAQRRLYLFKKNRRGFFSFWIFLVMFTLSMFAEFIANDRPLIVSYNGGLYCPVIMDYTETTFGGDFPTLTDYRDPYIIEQIESKGWILWTAIRFSYDTINYDLPVPAPAPPSAENWFGTDDLGRDVAARMIYGFRVSVLFGLVLTVISSIIGISAGAVQGYFGGRIDLIFQRFLEVWGSMPQLFILIIVSSIIIPSFWTLLFVLLLFSWTSLVGVVRAEFLRARNLEYVRAARALGMGDFHIM
ncbi:MAG: ABC transporter permease subunit, partial [Alphaproteobacteria bacterium]|nr:ABC transporter permease subunit [Alphaproteobacteria bacterium]